jgi:hypothetical protein
VRLGKENIFTFEGENRAMSSKKTVEHPFAKKDPKPTRARLVGLLDPLGRRRYSEVERFLAGISGATSGLHYFGTQNGVNWGWAVRYTQGDKAVLCVLHLLPETFEATIAANKEMQEALKATEISTETRRRIGRSKGSASSLMIRLPLKNDADFAAFKILINLKASCKKAKAGKAVDANKAASA